MHLNLLSISLATLLSTSTAHPSQPEANTDALEKRACIDNSYASYWQGGGCSTNWAGRCYSTCSGQSQNCCSGTLNSGIVRRGCFPGWNVCECSCYKKR